MCSALCSVTPMAVQAVLKVIYAALETVLKALPTFLAPMALETVLKAL